MLFFFSAALVLMVCACVGLQFWLKIRSLRSAEFAASALPEADRYRPMLRLLAEDDLAFLPADRKLRQKLRGKRRKLFRGYLRCLTRDYAHLLAGVRQAMVHSEVDRPDLARALARNRILFALAICKIDYHLLLHAMGIGKVDISSLVEALETLRAQVGALSSTPFSTAALNA